MVMGTSANLYAIHQTFSSMKTIHRGSVGVNDIISANLIENKLNKYINKTYLYSNNSIHTYSIYFYNKIHKHIFLILK